MPTISSRRRSKLLTVSRGIQSFPKNTLVQNSWAARLTFRSARPPGGEKAQHLTLQGTVNPEVGHIIGIRKVPGCQSSLQPSNAAAQPTTAQSCQKRFTVFGSPPPPIVKAACKPRCMQASNGH